MFETFITLFASAVSLVAAVFFLARSNDIRETVDRFDLPGYTFSIFTGYTISGAFFGVTLYGVWSVFV